MTQPTDPEELKTDEPSQDEVEAVAQAIHKCDEPGELADAPSAHRRFCYDAARAAIAAMPRRGGGATVVPLLLFCPKCNAQHIDAPDESTPDWSNPPHRSHLCHVCGCIWRPADVPTEGVATIQTVGRADTWTIADQPTPPKTPRRWLRRREMRSCPSDAKAWTLKQMKPPRR